MKRRTPSRMSRKDQATSSSVDAERRRWLASETHGEKVERDYKPLTSKKKWEEKNPNLGRNRWSRLWTITKQETPTKPMARYMNDERQNTNGVEDCEDRRPNHEAMGLEETNALWFLFKDENIWEKERGLVVYFTKPLMAFLRKRPLKLTPNKTAPRGWAWEFSLLVLIAFDI